MTDGARRTAIGGAVALGAGAVLALLGPFGTYPDLTPAARWAYWMILTPLLWLQVVAALAALRRWERFAALPVWSQAVAASLLGAIPATFEVAWAESLLRVGRPLSPASMLETWWGVALVALVVCVPPEWLAGRSAPGPRPVRAAPRFLDRIPARLGDRLLALSSEDHYLRVHTERGDDLILLPLAQAIEELGSEAGVRTHRSWWVARDAVEAVERDGDRTSLVLRGGLRVPVSRTYRLAVRDAGLLRD
jgi:hypothetical protein